MFLNNVEKLIRRDPGRRGLIASERTLAPLCLGHFASAAQDLAANGRRVVIVTGFFIPGANPPSAETDGPPGAALLAAALIHAGMTVQIVTDSACQNAVEVAAEEMKLNRSSVVTLANDPDCVDDWFRRENRTASQSTWTHLIAIERVGPSHTSESITDPLERAEFERLVAPDERGQCYNMKGDRLNAFTAPLHRLFERAQESSAIKTIGIGDGGNEIGMGSIPWTELQIRLNNPNTAKIPCRIATDWTILAGVSNWGGMALGAATLWLLDRADAVAPWTSQQQLNLLQRLVTDGPAVDGITRLPEPTVDGLPFLTYTQPWEGVRRLCGLES